MSASGESSTTMHRLLHESGSHPIPPPDDPKSRAICQLAGTDIAAFSFRENALQFNKHYSTYPRKLSWFVLNQLISNLLPISEQILHLSCSLIWFASEFSGSMQSCCKVFIQLASFHTKLTLLRLIEYPLHTDSSSAPIKGGHLELVQPLTESARISQLTSQLAFQLVAQLSS
ncbi:F-box/LRR-repeat protein-like [Dorcoceras hygrometricum]|uniref:F-box/LRR-repeat protein-like n=1 Tax=Dorcoceras hygrometricum TaxID=472368 RepID=A0A2Z7BSR5_9LAMI|nr:F-box/LRR-repeat protein-like [Dorcoceras hygrometricum]